MRNYLLLFFILYSINLLVAQPLSGIITYETLHQGGGFELGTDGANEYELLHFESVKDSLEKALDALYNKGSYKSQTIIYFSGASAYKVTHTHRANVHVLGNKHHDSFDFQRITSAGCEMAGKVNEHPTYLMDSCSFYPEADLLEGDSTRVILDMECQLWYWQKNEIQVKLWITKELPPSISPNQHQFLAPKGTVLAIEFPGSYETIATNIDIRAIDQYTLETMPLVELEPAHFLD